MNTQLTHEEIILLLEADLRVARRRLSGLEKKLTPEEMIAVLEADLREARRRIEAMVEEA